MFVVVHRSSRRHGVLATVDAADIRGLDTARLLCVAELPHSRHAATVFDDPLSSTFSDREHSTSERRFLIIGLSALGRVLVVAHTEIGSTIRLISPRQILRTRDRRDHSGAPRSRRGPGVPRPTTVNQALRALIKVEKTQTRGARH
ncbi:MAG: BrnT family toxin [Acidobacteria bacterium]|nr:BrnT family toxin [Acidobacteriota bacterium]